MGNSYNKADAASRCVIEVINVVGKHVGKRTYIARGGVLSGAEGASRAQAAQEGVVEGAAEAAAEVAAEAATERPQRAPRKCSMCYSIKHNARTCPRRQATS